MKYENLAKAILMPKTSINFIIAANEQNEYETLVNAGTEYYQDGLPVELYTKILSAVDNVVNEWNNNHKKQ